MDLKSTPGHGNSIPSPNPFAESEVGNCHHLQRSGDLEIKIIGLEGVNFQIWYTMCSWKFLESQGWSPDHLEPITPFPHSGLSF